VAHAWNGGQWCKVRLDELNSLGIDVPHWPHIVQNTDGVALRPPAVRKGGGVSGLGVASLGACPVNVMPRARHVSHRRAKGDVDRRVAEGAMGCPRLRGSESARGE